MADAKWRRIADRLAERLSNYEDCPQRGDHPFECPFCEDAAVYAEYVGAGGTDYRGSFTRAVGVRVITLAELAARPPDGSRDRDDSR
jgi:hypothetical protein